MKTIVFATYGLIIGSFALLFAPNNCAAEQPLRIVCTLSTYCDIASQVGGDAVRVDVIASPRFDAHKFEPRPSDIVRLQRADLLIHSGLDLEAWRGPLVDAAARAELRVGGTRELGLASVIPLLEKPTSLSRSQGDIHAGGNPHFQLDPRNAISMANLIAQKLAELDANHAATFRAGAASFKADIETRIANWTTRAQTLRGTNFFAYHNEWIYLANFLGFTIVDYLEPLPGIAPTPTHLEQLLGEAKAKPIRGIIAASYNPQAALSSLSEKSGVPIRQLCQHVGERPECGSFQQLIDFNLQQLFQGGEDGN